MLGAGFGDTEYTKRTQLSKVMFERAKKVEPAGVSYKNRYFEPYPFFVKEAHGAKLIDIDENEYTDYWLHSLCVDTWPCPPNCDCKRSKPKQRTVGTSELHTS